MSLPTLVPTASCFCPYEEQLWKKSISLLTGSNPTMPWAQLVKSCSVIPMQDHSQPQRYTVTPQDSTWRGASCWSNTCTIIWSKEFLNEWWCLGKKKYNYLTFLLSAELVRLNYKNRTNTSTGWLLWNSHINHYISQHSMHSFNSSFWDNSPLTSAVNQPLTQYLGVVPTSHF